MIPGSIVIDWYQMYMCMMFAVALAWQALPVWDDRGRRHPSQKSSPQSEYAGAALSHIHITARRGCGHFRGRN